MKGPKISVIVPVYNVSEYISRCADSIVSQKLYDIEIIFVNDGSKDNSREIVEKYQLNDFRITILDKENGGLSSARNYGLRHAKGEYILFVDSDDYLELNALSIRVKDQFLMQSNQGGLVLSEGNKIIIRGTEVKFD